MVEKHSGNNRLLTSRFPDIAKEWNLKRNLPLTVDDITYGSGKKVWWICSKGHDYQSTVSNRTSGKNCPYCSGNKLIHTNSLAVKYPEIASDFHPTKNGALTPDDFAAKSHKKVYWQCPNFPEHTWKASISSRTNLNSGCPLCSRQTSLPELRLYTEILALYPDAINRFRIKGTESDIFIPSHELAIEFDGSYFHRNKRDVETRKEAHFKSLGITLLRIRVHPLKKIHEHDVVIPEGELSKEVLNTIINTVTTMTRTKVLLEKYLKYDSFLNSPVYNKYVNYLPNPFPDDTLSKRFPNIANQWNTERNSPLTPENFTPGSGKKVWWQCDKNINHEWESSITARVRGRGCPYCANKMVNHTNSLKDNFGHIAQELHPTKNKPNSGSLSYSSNRIVWWLCHNGHEYRSSIKNRAINKVGCPYCDGRKATSETSILKLYPEISEEWDYEQNHPKKPENFLPKSQQKVSWICSHDSEHKWEAVIAARTSGGGCPYCSGRLATKINNLAAEYPSLLKEWDFVNNEKSPENYKSGSGKKVSWICKDNPEHKWIAVIYSRTKMGTGCPICARKRKR